MKSLKSIIGLAILAVSLSGCNKELEPESGGFSIPYYQYWFAVNFQDSTGNDLVAPFKGMEKLEGCTLDITLSNLKENNESYKPHFLVRDFGLNKNWYLFHELMYFRKSGFNNMLTYSIKFPTIFGDDKVHEIVTYWGDDPIVSSANEEASLMPECTKAIFNGKELAINKVAHYSTSREGSYYIYCIDIVLD